MIVRIDIEVEGTVVGENPDIRHYEETFQLGWYTEGESHSERERLVHRMDALLQMAGVKNTGRHGGAW